MMTKAMYHVPNMSIRNANFRLQTYNNLNRLFPLKHRSFERLKVHKRISYFYVLFPLLCLLFLLIVF